jgi:hypothetical protein
MIIPILRLDLQVHAVALLYHLSGLSEEFHSTFYVAAVVITILTCNPVGKQGEAWSHLQARRVLCQGVPRCGEGEDSHAEAEQAGRVFLRRCRV